MNLLDRHIFKSVFGTCATAVALFAFVVALPHIVRELLNPLLVGQFELTTFARLVALLFPFAVSLALPMGILTGVLLTLGRLSADSEITAMRAAGISLGRIACPIFVLAVFCSVGALYINLESAPWARAQYHREFAEAVRTNPLGIIVPKTFIREFRGTVLYVGAKDGPLLHDIWLWSLDDQSRVRRLVRAESGRLDYDEATNSLVPTLLRAKIEERDAANPEDFSKSPKSASFERLEEWRIPLDRYLGRNLVRIKPEWFTLRELRIAQARHAAQPPPPDAPGQHAREQMRFALIVQEKINLSLAVFSFALLGVPLGIKISRRETSANLGLALLLALGFYVLTVAFKGLDKYPACRPDLLIWLPNLLCLGLGLWLFRRIERK